MSSDPFDASFDASLDADGAVGRACAPRRCVVVVVPDMAPSLVDAMALLDAAVADEADAEWVLGRAALDAWLADPPRADAPAAPGAVDQVLVVASSAEWPALTGRLLDAPRLPRGTPLQHVTPERVVALGEARWPSAPGH